MDSRSPSSFACDPLSASASLDRWLRQLLRTSFTTPAFVAHQKRLNFSTLPKSCAARISFTATSSFPSHCAFLAFNFSVQPLYRCVYHQSFIRVISPPFLDLMRQPPAKHL